MVRNELVRRSPLRILEKSTRGGLGTGNIGVITGPKGVGKTACLVHIATDRLLQQKHVIHVSFRSDALHIISWYEDIFTEIARQYNLDCAMDVHDDIIRNRIVMTFRQDGTHWPAIEKCISGLMSDTHFSVDTVVVDGFDFSAARPDEMQTLRRFAVDRGLEFWFSATAEMVGGGDIPGSLAPFSDSISIIVGMQQREGHVRLGLVKDHDNPPVPDLHLKLDPQTLLIAEE